MGDDEAQQQRQSLLSDSKDHSNLVDRIGDLQRRRLPRSGGSSSKTNHQEQEDLIQQTPLQFPPHDLVNSETAKPDFQSNNKLVLFLLTAYLGLGTLSFFLVRHQIKGIQTNGFLDALYFSVVTMTTVGYGDLVPCSKLSKLLACIYVFTGMALCGIILSKAADYFLEKQEILLVKAIHSGEHSDLLREIEAHKVKYKLLLVSLTLVVLIIGGTFFLYMVENLEFLDAFYCVCSTITTLGYGDKSFSTSLGRGFAVLWILTSTVCLAQFFLCLAELYTEDRHRSLVKMVLSRKFSLSDLEAADLDHDKVVR